MTITVEWADSEHTQSYNATGFQAKDKQPAVQGDGRRHTSAPTTCRSWTSCFPVTRLIFLICKLVAKIHFTRPLLRILRAKYTFKPHSWPLGSLSRGKIPALSGRGEDFRVHIHSSQGSNYTRDFI